MYYKTNVDLTNFEFWSGAKNHKFTNKELMNIECIIDDLFSQEITETQINDLFWFEEEFLCDSISLNYKSYLNR